MPRPKTDHADLKVRVPLPLLQDVQKRLTLRYNEKPQFGAMSRLVEVLLRKWLGDEVAVDPMKPVSLSLDNLMPAMPEENSNEVPTNSSMPDGPTPDAQGAEAR